MGGRNGHRMAEKSGFDCGCQFEANAFSDGLVGMWWGALGGAGIVAALAGLLCGLEVAQRWSSAASSTLGFSIPPVALVAIGGLALGALCGFAAASVAHYVTGATARAFGGILTAVTGVVVGGGLTVGDDLALGGSSGVFEIILASLLVASGAGVMAGLNCGRDVGW